MSGKISSVKSSDLFDPQSILTAKEVCQLLRINRRTLQRWCHSKPPKLTYIQLSPNKIGFRRQLIEFFLKQREIQGCYQVETEAA
jgi:predicted site-specific integrase-resolvase